MFSIYERHNNKLYNKLVKLSRNKFFYQEIKQILNNCKMENNIMSRIGTKFLQKNVELLY